MNSRLELITLAIVSSLVLSVVTTAPASAATTTRDKFVGTWIGTWPHGKSSIELKVDRIDADGNVYGIYCWVANTDPWRSWFDIHPNHGVAAKLRNNKIRWKRPTARWAFGLRGKAGTTLRLEFREKGKKLERMSLDREAMEDSECLARLRKLPRAK